MKIYPKVKKIARKNRAIRRWGSVLNHKLGCDGLNWELAKFIDGCSIWDGHLYQNGTRLDKDGLVDNDYFFTQYSGYCENDYHGMLYFGTNVPGIFVAVPFWV